MEDIQIQSIDPETEFLASKQETGNEWELFKENIRPLKRGRNISLLNNSLASHNDIQLKKSLLDNRRRLIEAIDEYQGDDPLHPWLQCIKWVQEAFPAGGDSSGLLVIYEQCVRRFWHSERYKDDLRYLKVWLEYVGFCFLSQHFPAAENCVDAEVIFSFLDANDIGKTHSAYYIAYALHMESKSKMKAANDLFSLGISRLLYLLSFPLNRNAQPTEKLKDAYKKFLVRSMRRPKAADEDLEENHLPARSFGTVLAREDNRRQTMQSTDQQRKKLKLDGTHKTHQKEGEHGESSTLQDKQGDGQDIKRETELLRKNPLRNFPPNSLPR
ncbi:hypothetical protein Patl1_09319 [Pistacia atlantica]|uniref:Uncharacterized protein n=1 Tax=Pistacia atlantica TaxID=434234 RepID=A0ACC1AKJ4_9ROSI|nr:hypothetical protein Patl1_09319 [Pistacia atlantica]